MNVVFGSAGWDFSVILVVHPTEHELWSFFSRVLLQSGVGGLDLVRDVVV